ncbi:rapamycin-insensitive companion of mTOR-like isoform X3 [Gouania willdenowi]|nr:rapamycin-insensitive companion of mTOR-like isoform X3 [Gouania willdenowi]
MEVRKGLLEVLFEIFQLTLPRASADFHEALTSTDSGRFKDNWRLSDGFVASEAKTVLPQRSGSRPDLMDNYLALLLSAFIKTGLFEALVDVITSSTDVISIWATILLGELLHMANTILPHSQSHHLYCLPSLVNMAACCDYPPEKRLRASAAVNDLKDFHQRKKRGIKPTSLFLDHILRTAVESQGCKDTHSKTPKDIVIIKDYEDSLLSLVRDSHVLSHRETMDWNWHHIETILKWPHVSLRGNELMHKFVQRLVFFYKPSLQLYSDLEVEHPKGRQLTVVGCQFVEFLLASEEDGQMYLEDLVRDIVHYLFFSAGHKDQLSSRLLVTLSQNYFLFLGILSAHPHGVRLLEKGRVFQCLLGLCSLQHQEHLLKLTVSALDYSRDGLARVLLSKILTAASDGSRLYATKHLRVLLRVGVEFFSNWGIELLVTQLHDRCMTVSMEALDILDEASEDQTVLHALTEMRPALLHMGDKGMLLLLRLLSIPKGFSYLSDNGYVKKQMEMWKKVYNLQYVDMIEGRLNKALTTYRKPVNNDSYVRRSSQSEFQRHNVYPPVHLYGQLAHEKTGCKLLKKQNVVSDLSYTVRSPVLETWEGVKQLKAALWALGNIGSSNWGLNLLLENRVIPDIMALAHHCEVLSLRGTCLYVLGFISKTRQGCDTLKQHGWDAVRHSRSSLWPVVSEELETGLDLCHTTSDLGNVKLTEPNSTSHKSLTRGMHTSFVRKTATEKERTLSIGDDDEEDTENQHGSCHDQLGEDWHLRGRENQFKSHSQSFNSDNSSCLSSPSSSPSKDILLSTEATDGANLSSTTGTTQSSALHLCSSLLSLPKSYSMYRARPCGSLTSVRRTQSLKYSSHCTQSSSLGHSGSREASGKSRWKYSHTGCTSSQDAQGYATLRRLQHQRIQPSLSRCESLGSPAKDILLANAITMKSGSLDSTLASRRFMRALGCASLDKEELLSPINKTTLQRSSSLRSFVTSTTLNPSEEYMGLALPFDISNMLQIKERPYFKKMISLHSVEGSDGFCSTDSSDVTGGSQGERQLLDSEEAEFQEHIENNCLYCGLSQLGFSCQQGVKFIPEDAMAGRVLLRKKVLRLVINLSSSVGTKNHETSLLMIKEKFPHAFDDICLYSEVSYLLSQSMFHLPTRRFIQELFQDVTFTPMYEAAENVLSTTVHKASALHCD